MNKRGDHGPGRGKGPADLNELGEFGFIARMSRSFTAGLPAGVKGIGDDCAVLPWTKDERLVVTTDMLIEDRHFVRDGIEADDLGYKSLAVNLSDVAAMGGRPKWALLSLGIPAGVDLIWLDRFYRGWRYAARAAKVFLVGGDTTKSPAGVVINVVVIGTVEAGREKLRSAARLKDVIAVTGTLGDSGGGLKIILARAGKDTGLRPGEPGSGAVSEGAGGRPGAGTGGAAGSMKPVDLRIIPGGAENEARTAGKAGPGAASWLRREPFASPVPSGFRISPGENFGGAKPEVFRLARSGWKTLVPYDRQAERDEARLIQAHTRPRPHIEEGEWLAQQPGVRAMMDVSDGIDSDVRRIMEQSGVGARIDLDKLPISEALRREAERRGFEAIETAASGGEDYCLLVTVEREKFGKIAAGFESRFKRPLAAIGAIGPKSSGLRYFRGGRPAKLRSRGFDHFR